MSHFKKMEFPPALKKLYRKAFHFELLSFFYMISATIFSFLAMGNSQTMKTVWLEDMLGVIPPASFLLSSYLINWKPNKNFPYGYHKVQGIAYLSSSLALFALGAYLLIDGASVLLKAEHPHIPTIQVLGHDLWFGYIMILALLWSSVPSTILGHIKIPLAKQLYDKILYADSKMNKASWMAGFASIFGIIGIGLGYWWADASIAMLISLDIMNDGYSNVKQAILDLLDEIPKQIDSEKNDPLIKEVKTFVLQYDWIDDALLRFRDEGHVFFGEIFIQVKHSQVEVKKLDELRDAIQNLHWRLHDITIIPTKSVSP